MGGTMQHQTPHQASKPRRILRRREAAQYIGRSERALERYATDGGGPKYVRIGAKAVGYTIEDLDAWLKARTFSSTSEEDAARNGKAA